MSPITRSGRSAHGSKSFAIKNHNDGNQQNDKVVAVCEDVVAKRKRKSASERDIEHSSRELRNKRYSLRSSKECDGADKEKEPVHADCDKERKPVVGLPDGNQEMKKSSRLGGKMNIKEGSQEPTVKRYPLRSSKGSNSVDSSGPSNLTIRNKCFTPKSIATKGKQGSPPNSESRWKGKNDSRDLRSVRYSLRSCKHPGSSDLKGKISTTITIPMTKQKKAANSGSQVKIKRVSGELGSKRYPLISSKNNIGVEDTLMESWCAPDSQELCSKRHPLRSSADGARVASPAEPSVSVPSQPKSKKRGRHVKRKSTPKNEFLAMKNRMSYLFHRMNYQQSLIDAYLGEGWKGLSLEKLRPEKEIERAKEEILKCKIRIRDTFQLIDSRLCEGKLDASLFDSTGEIFSEDIFCAQCGLKSVSANNDIILCDGICDRGFHQKCLIPPLLTENIPPGEEGWLCPACNCKIDCLQLLNETQGVNISIEDSWEEVFPEVANISDSGKKLDEVNLSSDSEDEDYIPGVLEGQREGGSERSSPEENDNTDESGFEDSDFVASEPDVDTKPENPNNFDVSGLPSEDSEDDDYNPDAPNLDECNGTEDENSNGSDFSSDSDDFCKELLAKASDDGEVSTPLFRPLEDGNTAFASLPIMDLDSGHENVSPLLDRRLHKNLDDQDKPRSVLFGDCKHDDFSGGSSVKEKEGGPHGYVVDEPTPSYPSNRTLTLELMECDASSDTRFMSHLSPRKQNNDPGSSRGNSSVHGRISPTMSQRLHEYFMTDQFPSQSMKEQLAQELGLTVWKINKWFASRRHRLKVLASKATDPSNSFSPENGSTSKDKSTAVVHAHSECKPVSWEVSPVISMAGATDAVSNCQTPRELTDDERRKAIQRELRKRRMIK